MASRKDKSDRRFTLDPRWRSFPAAREYVRALGLSSHEEWHDYASGRSPEIGVRPDDIPATPQWVYRYHGWSGYADWLGASRRRRFRGFRQARRFVRTLGLTTLTEWRGYSAGRLPGRGVRPRDIPSTPDSVYRDKGWISWYDWLGNAVVVVEGRTFAPFEEARRFARSLGLRTIAEWYQYVRHRPRAEADEDSLRRSLLSASGVGTPPPGSSALPQTTGDGTLPRGTPELPSDVPVFPNTVYAEFGWTNWRDWLGVPPRRPEGGYRGYEVAREFARGLRLKSCNGWRAYCRGELPLGKPLPEDIPCSPHVAYRGKGWTSWGDWLGTGRRAAAGRVYRPFQQARSFARALQLRSGAQWQQFCRGELPGRDDRLPPDIPAKPWRVYKGEWLGTRDWLGNEERVKRTSKFRPFRDARRYARALGLQSFTHWREYCRGHVPEAGARPDDIPFNPDRVYRNRGWVSWRDWLGTANVSRHRRRHRPFTDARRLARGLGLRSSKEWREFCAAGKCPADIPRSPHYVYRDEGWVSWGDWLGTGAVAPGKVRFRPFREARRFVRDLGLRSRTEWFRYGRGEYPEKGRRPSDIPADPSWVYRDEWVGWKDFLGTDAARGERGG